MSIKSRRDKHKQRQYAAKQNALMARQQRREAFARAHTPESTLQALRHRLEDKVHEVQDAVSGAVDRVRHAGEEVAHKATELAEQVKSTVSEKIDQLVHGITDRLHTTDAKDADAEGSKPTA